MIKGAPEGAARARDGPAPARSVVQRKPALGRPGDRYEREADRVADRVVAGERSVAASYGSLLRFPVTVRTPPLAPLDPQRAGEPVDGCSGTVAPTHVETTRGRGRPLADPLRSVMERGFGVDFGGVTIHTGASAAAASGEIQARAFTLDTDIYFGPGEYRPETPSGRRLIAHELTHTLQQGRDRTVRRAPGGESVEQLVIYTDTSEVLVITNKGRYRYKLTLKKGLTKGTYRWKHTKGTTVDKAKDDLIEAPPGARRIDWRIAPERRDQLSWPDYEDSEFEMIVIDSSKIVTGGGKKAGAGKAKGAGKGKAAGKGPSDDKSKGKGKRGGGKKKEVTEAEKKAKVDLFLAKLKEKGGGGGSEKLTREKLEKIVGEWDEADIDEFFELFDQARSEHPLKSTEEILEWYGKLTPSQKEILRVNKTLGASLEEGAPGELPEDIQLMITTEAKETTDVTKKVNDTNKSLDAIRRKVHEVDPERAKNFEKLDPQKLTAFNEMMALEALLAGASERSPEIAGIAKSLTRNIGRIRSYILEELAWLAGELAATTLLSILTAPLTGGASAAAGAGRAALLVMRLNRLRKLLNAIQKIRAVVDTLQRIKAIYDKVQTVIAYKDKLKEYREKLTKLIELKKRITSASEEIGEKYHEDMDALEDEILAIVRELIEAKGGLGEILDFLYLPEDADEEELRKIIQDLPRGLDAATDMFKYYRRMEEGDLEATKVLMFKAYATGYLLYPLVGFIADLANEKLNELMREKSLDERLLEMLSRASSGRRKGKGASNRKKFKSVRSKKEKRKEERKRRKKKKDKEDEKKGAKRKKKAKEGRKGDETPKTKKRKKKEDEASDEEAKKRKKKKKKEEDDDERKKKAGDKDEEDEAKKKKEKEKEKEDEDDDKLSKEDKLWRKLGREIRDLPDELSGGATQEAALRAARKITGKAKYRAVAGGVSAPGSSTNPAYWQVTVQRRRRGTPYVALVLKSPRTRYYEIRKAIKKDFESIADKDRTREYITAKVEGLRAKHHYQHVRVEHRKDGATVTGWVIEGKLPGKSYHEILTIDSTENSWGSQTNPISLDWPKPKISDYPSVFVGPPVGTAVKLDQTDVKGLADKAKADREAFADSHADATNQKNLDAWKAAGSKVETYSPTSRKALPSPSKSTIGVTGAHQVAPKFKFRLEPKGGTPGGSKILGPLAHFGYSATNEGTAGDHVVEHSLGGPDSRENLWPLNAKVNSSSGATLQSMSFPKPGGTDVITMAQLKNQARKSGKKNQVWFRINSVRSAT